MRALLCSLNYAPELTGIGKYTGEMAEWLAARGMHVTVVTAPPYYPAWRVEHPYSAHRYARENVRGVDVIRCPIWVPRQATALKRILHLASFALTSLPVMLWLAIRLRPKIVLVIEPPLFAAPGARLAAWLAGAKAWLHVQDFEVDAAFDMGFLRAGLLRRAVLAFEGWLMRGFDRVSTISERMVARLSAKKVAAERTQLFPNWVELDRIRPLPSASDLRAPHFGDDKIIVLYAGSMGRKQGLETVLQAASVLAPLTDKLQFVMCGDGPGRQELERSAAGATNVTFWPLVPAERLNDLLNIADIHIMPQRADAQDLVFPSKLTNMLASGRPVVATVNAETQIAEMLDGCGVVVPPGAPLKLADALRSLAADAGLRRALGEAARRTAERLWDKNSVLAQAFREHVGAHVQMGVPPRPIAAESAHSTTAA